jgi:ribonucleoside-diphosphate reductase alpha chain
VEDIMDAYLQAWKLGLKAVAIYRDGCKKSQPLSAAGTKTASAEKSAATAEIVEAEDLNAPPRSVRHKLQEERASITHKFKVGDHEGYVTVGLYPNGDPGELFVKMAKEGSTVSGLMDSFALAVSLALQYGVPLKTFCEKFAHTRFEPSGWSGNPEIGYAKSIMDYIFRWMQMRFLTGQQQMLFENLRLRPAALGPQSEGTTDADSAVSVGVPKSEVRDRGLSVHAADALSSIVDLGDAPSCSFCGSIMTRNGSCYRCMSCGSTSGCS